MLSGHVEGQLLRILVHATRARRVLEIGMFTGYSALAMAEALPADGRVVACEIDPGVAAFAQRCFDDVAGGDARSTSASAPALDTLERWPPQVTAFDLVFIDADKAGYGAYLDAVLDGGLLAPHGAGLRRQHPDAGPAVAAPGRATRQRRRHRRIQRCVAADDPGRAGAASRSATG